MEILSEAAKQVPSLCVLCFIVVIFIRFIKSEREQSILLETARLGTLKSIGDGCHEHTKQLTAKMNQTLVESARAIKDNTKALGRNTEAFHRVEKVIDHIRSD